MFFRLCGGSGFHSGAGCGFQRTSFRHLSHQVFMQPFLYLTGVLHSQSLDLYHSDMRFATLAIGYSCSNILYLTYFAPAVAGPLLVMIILTYNYVLYSVRVTRSRRCTLSSPKKIRVLLCAVIVFVLFMCVVAEISKKRNKRQYFSKKR